MKKILLVALISYISISSICAMSYEQREKKCNEIFANLQEALQYFQLGNKQACLSGLAEIDSTNIFWQKNREIALEYAAIAVMSARTSHEELIKKYAPLFQGQSLEKVYIQNLLNNQFMQI